MCAFRLRWQVSIENLPAGMSAMTANGNIPAPGMAPTGIGPTLALFQTTTPVSQASASAFTAGTFTISAQTGDAGILTGALATDLYAQLTSAANLARLTGFITGQP